MVALRILYVKSIYMITHTCRSAQMKIGACFFATIPLEDRQTVTTDGHVHHCLPNFGASAAKKRDSAAVFVFLFLCSKRQCAHSSNNGRLSDWERGAAVAALTFARRLSVSVPFLPVPRSEETTEGHSVGERRRCMSSVHEGVKTDLDTYVRRAIIPLIAFIF